jgi:peptidoglycan/LPS O-acetylase OafA/YrhL
MDYFAALTLAALAILLWVIGVRRKGRPLWVALLIVPAVAWLGFYFGWTLYVSRPELYSGEAQVGLPTLLAMMFGVFAFLAKPKNRKARRGPGEGATA